MSRKTIKVMGFGTFDGIHEGHLNFFVQLCQLGDKLMIVVGRDSNVENIKGRAVKNLETDRLKALEAIDCIDEVILGDSDDFYQCINTHNPDVIGLGYDQQADMSYLKREFPHIEVVRLKPFKPEKYKSSLL